MLKKQATKKTNYSLFDFMDFYNWDIDPEVYEKMVRYKIKKFCSSKEWEKA